MDSLVKKVIYLSGGIAGLASGQAEDSFNRYGEMVVQLGGAYINPMHVRPWPGACPKDSIKGGQGHTWACHMRADLLKMLEADAVLMLPGWERSHGARFEQHVAANVGIPVYYASGVTLVARDSYGYPLHQFIEGTR